MAFRFTHAFDMLVFGRKMRRLSWRPDKFVWVFYPETPDQLQYLEITTDDGRAPYVPSQCDMFASDWVEADKKEPR